MYGTCGRGTGSATREAIVNLLKTQGPSDPGSIAARLGISPMAVRQHLYSLRLLKLVTYKQESRPTGRPAKVWRLLRAADRCFPDRHAGLSVSLIEAARSAFGPKQFGRLLARLEERERQALARLMQANASLKKKISVLARIRSSQGYLAEVKEREEGVFLLIENHCPVLTAAMACSGLCEAEQGAFQKVLGPACRIERTEHAVEGSRRCVYRIHAAA